MSAHLARKGLGHKRDALAAELGLAAGAPRARGRVLQHRHGLATAAVRRQAAQQRLAGAAVRAARGACENCVGGGFQAPFPPAAANRLLLSAQAALTGKRWSDPRNDLGRLRVRVARAMAWGGGRGGPSSSARRHCRAAPPSPTAGASFPRSTLARTRQV